MERNYKICIMENLHKSGIVVSLEMHPFETIQFIYMFEQI